MAVLLSGCMQPGEHCLVEGIVLTVSVLLWAFVPLGNATEMQNAHCWVPELLCEIPTLCRALFSAKINR